MLLHYVFLSKEGTIVPQSLEAGDAGEIIRALLLQQFEVLPLQIQAANSKEAMAACQKVISAQSQRVAGMRAGTQPPATR